MFSTVSKKQNTFTPGLFKVGLVALIGLCAGGAPASAQQNGQMGQALRQACMADYKALCSGVKPGSGQVMACFRENASKLSPACQEALEAAKAARQASGSK